LAWIASTQPLPRLCSNETLFEIEARDLLPAGIGVDAPAGGVGEEDADRSERAQGLEARFALAQALLHLQALADISPHAADDRLLGPLRPKRIVVLDHALGAHPCLHAHQPARRAFLRDLGEIGREEAANLGHEELAQVPADDFFRAVKAQESNERAIHAQDGPLEIVQADQVVAILDQVAEPLLAPA
jgi:hypothetical protein